MPELRAVLDPNPKNSQHLKIVLKPDGTLDMVQIYSDAQGDKEKILAVYEELKQEIVDFGNRTTKLVAVYEHESNKKKKNKPWRLFGGKK